MAVISSTQAKARFSELVEKTEKGAEVIIQRRGKPVAVILSYQTYQDMLALREKARREEALARLRALAREVQAQNQALPPEERASLADNLAREAAESLVQKGVIQFVEL